MTLLNPAWLWLLLPLGIFWFTRYRDGYSIRNRYHLGLMATAVFIILALCRPVLEKEPVEVDQSGSDIIVAVDLSHSMQATDETPTRLGAARQILQTLIQNNTQDRFGVIGFTTNAIILSPMTNDGELLLHLFGSLDEQMIITKGTHLMSALELARKMSAAEHPKVLLLTDGGDAQSYADEAVYAKSSNLQVNVVLLGSDMGSTLNADDGTLLKDKKGNIVVSSLNRAVKQIAEYSGGAVIQGPDVSAIASLLRSQKEQDYRSKTKIMEYDELFYYVVAAAILAFIMTVTTVGERRGVITGIWIVFWVLVGIRANAGMLDPVTLYQAHKAYETGDYSKAAQKFGGIDRPEAYFNAANSLYKAGEYAAALNLYKLVRTRDSDVKADVLFNMANCYIRLQEFDQAKELLRQSLMLKRDVQAMENLYAITQAEAQDHMITGRQKGKERESTSSAEATPKAKKDRKEGGGSNMKAAAQASSGGGEGGKKVRSSSSIGLSKGNAQLSSKQYEMINKRSVNEIKPW